MNLKELSGLQLLQMMADKKLPSPSISKTIPMDFSNSPLKEGSVEFECRPNETHLNTLGGVHGGFIATVLDSAASCAIHTALDKGMGYGTTDLNVKMMRPLQPDTIYKVSGKTINVSRRLGVAEAELRDETGKIYAHATVSCMLFEL